MADKNKKVSVDARQVNLAKPDRKNIFRFLHKSYDESVALLVQARDYFATQVQAEKSNFSLEQKLAYTFALSTITTQLTSVMGWLMFCKAIERGEVAQDQIKDEDLTMPEFNCAMDEDHSLFGMLNSTTVEIIEKTASLYNRVKRMESPIKERLIELA